MIGQLLANVRAKLTDTDAPDPLEEFRDGRPAALVWKGLPMSRKRAITQKLVKISLHRAPARGYHHSQVVVDDWLA